MTVVGRWSLVVGRWSLVVGRWSLVVGRWSCLILAFGGCAAETAVDSGDPAGLRSEALEGNTTLDMTATTGAVGATGAFLPPGQPFTSGFCSGTVVARGTLGRGGATGAAVLTARHCFDSGALGANGVPIAPTAFGLPQAGGWFANVTRVALHAGGSTVDRRDLAIAHLAQDVPVAVLAAPMRVALFNLPSDHRRLSRYQAVGFGCTNFDCIPPDFGGRRFGPLAPYPALDPDDALLCEGSYNNDYQWEAPNHTAGGTLVTTDKGDSGGGLFATFSAGGGTVVVGVCSGRVDPPDCEDKGTFKVWAMTGGSDGNADFIRRNLGDDLDDDGILEQVDNCPVSLCVARGLDADACSNPFQHDADGDSIGDACDNCDFVLNLSQRDLDNDGQGDLCDLCPLLAGQDPTADRDQDRLGDACDPCPGSVQVRTPCQSDAQCSSLGGACLVEPGSGAVSGCVELVDSDRDSIPDQCDACNGIPSTDLRNSNHLAEKRESLLRPVPQLPDVCDPVPIVRFAPQNLQEVRGESGQPFPSVVTIRGETWLGREISTSRRVAATQGVRLRHCECGPGVRTQSNPEEFCIGGGMFHACSWADPMSSSAARWQNMSTTIGARPDDWANKPFQTNVAYPLTADWSWRSDLLAEGNPNCASAPSILCQTNSAIAANVRNISTSFSARDDASKLRDTFTLHRYPSSFNLGVVPLFSPPNFCARNGGSCISLWMPWGYRGTTLINPVIDPFWMALRGLSRLQIEGSSVTALRVGLPAIDLTGRISSSFLENVQGGTERLYLPAAEAGWRLAHAGLADSSMLFLPRNPAPGATPSVAFLAAGLLDLRAASEVFGSEGVQGLAASDAYVLPQGTNTQAAFSRIEKNLYLVGGELDGHALGLLARMDLASGETTYISPVGVAPSSTVLDVTYDQPRRLLYVLDVDDEVILGQRKARLSRYDMATATGKVLMRWPYTPLYAATYLSVSDSGDVILIVDSDLGYTAWRIRIAGDTASFSGVATGLGSLLGKPTMGEQAPALPIWRWGGLALDTLADSAFAGSGSCLAL